MAKILDRLFLGNTGYIVDLRQSYEWVKTEIATLEEYYGEKKEKRLYKFVAKSNKKLVRSAYKACDKTKFADSVMAKKLADFDAKNYLSIRKVNHKASQDIFKAQKEGRDWTEVISLQKEKIAALQDKRNLYVKKLTEERENYLAKNSAADDTEYKALLEKIKKERREYSELLDKNNAQKIEKQRAKLEKKLQQLDSRIKKANANRTNCKKLDDDVILSVKGLKMYFGGLRAVDNLDFEVKKGEIFGLIGPNGAGKTTVFNCITQFYKPTAGELLFKTREGEVLTLTDYKVHDIVLNGIARTFQNVEVVKEVSVLENLLIASTRNYTSSLFTQMFHLPKLKREEKAIRARADRILQYMDLVAYRNRLCWGLPYGILKRVEIARALMCNPQLIILDEPAAGLNEQETTELATLIDKIRKDFDCTVLLVEHDMSLVMNICDHICAISFGKKLAYGTAKEVQSSKEVQEAYLGVGGEE